MTLPCRCFNLCITRLKIHLNSLLPRKSFGNSGVVNLESCDTLGLFSDLSMEVLSKVEGNKDLGGMFASMWL